MEDNKIPTEEETTEHTVTTDDVQNTPELSQEGVKEELPNSGIEAPATEPISESEQLLVENKEVIAEVLPEPTVEVPKTTLNLGHGEKVKLKKGGKEMIAEATFKTATGITVRCISTSQPRKELGVFSENDLERA